MTRRLTYPLVALSGVAMLAAIGWWWVVFHVVIVNASMSVHAAIPCLVSNSDLCTLAQALCTGDHWYGIRHYDVWLFRAGAVLAVGALLAPMRYLAATWAAQLRHPNT